MKNLTPKQKKELFPDNCILMAYRGSITHGTYIGTEDSIDDIDLMGVYMAPPKHYLGLGLGKKYDKGQDKFVGKYDIVNYEFKHFVSLLLKSNPNVLSCLFLLSEHYEHVDPYFRVLLDNKHLFMSKQIYKTHIGYAISQRKRMQGDNKYLGYMGEKRKKLVDKYGFDTKMASHTVRLLRMGKEALETGNLQVYRTDDRAELLSIKSGEYSKAMVDSLLDDLFNDALKAFNNSNLPDNIDRLRVDNLVIDIFKDYLFK